MPIKVIALCMFLSMVFSLHAFKEEDIILVDTLYAELSLTNSIFYNMQTDAYMYYPHYTVLEISYGRSGFGAPGIIEGRGVASFQIPPYPWDTIYKVTYSRPTANGTGITAVQMFGPVIILPLIKFW